MTRHKTILFLHGPFMRTSRLLLMGLSSFAAEKGWQVLHFSPPKRPGRDYLQRLADSWNALGIVEDCGVERSMPLPGRGFGLPFVCIDLNPLRMKSFAVQSSVAARRIGFVNADSELYVRMAAEELLRHDFAAYAYVSAYYRRHWSERRREAFKDMVKASGGKFHAFDGIRQETGDAAAIRKLGNWLDSLPKPCGLLAANDRIAELVLFAAKRGGIAVPDMMCVIGIDDDEMLCESVSPPLTSIQADFSGGGRLAGRLLADLAVGRAHAAGSTLLYGAVGIAHRLSTRRLKREMPSVRATLEEIRRRALGRVSAADILPMLGGSRRSAEKRFTAATGRSIQEEIMEVRFEKVLSLLERGGTPLGMIADAAGFASPNLLQRQFKARYGTTLSDYRKRLVRT